jgi:excisionase family DNA binding protein
VTKPRASIRCPREPLGLSLEEAAAYIGLGPSLFERLVGEGKMPFPRQLAGRKVWDADEVAAAFRRVPRAAPANLQPGAMSMHDDEPESPWGGARL